MLEIRADKIYVTGTLDGQGRGHGGGGGAGAGGGGDQLDFSLGKRGLGGAGVAGGASGANGIKGNKNTFIIPGQPGTRIGIGGRGGRGGDGGGAFAGSGGAGGAGGTSGRGTNGSNGGDGNLNGTLGIGPGGAGGGGGGGGGSPGNYTGAGGGGGGSGGCGGAYVVLIAEFEIIISGVIDTRGTGGVAGEDGRNAGQHTNQASLRGDGGDGGSGCGGLAIPARSLGGTKIDEEGFVPSGTAGGRGGKGGSGAGGAISFHAPVVKITGQICTLGGDGQTTNAGAVKVTHGPGGWNRPANFSTKVNGSWVSETPSGAWKLNPPVFICPAGAPYTSNSASITIDANNPCVSDLSVHYQLGGGTPSYGTPRYTGPISLTENTIVRAIVYAPGWVASNVASKDVRFKVAPPALTPSVGSFGFYRSAEPFNFFSQTPTPGAVVRYTLDGSCPTTQSPIIPAGGVEVCDRLLVRVAGFHPKREASSCVPSLSGDPAEYLVGLRGTVTSITPGLIGVDWPSKPGESYELQWSTDLSSFTAIPAAKLSGANNNLIETTGFERLFIRIVVQ